MRVEDQSIINPAGMGLGSTFLITPRSKVSNAMIISPLQSMILVFVAISPKHSPHLYFHHLVFRCEEVGRKGVSVRLKLLQKLGVLQFQVQEGAGDFQFAFF